MIRPLKLFRQTRVRHLAITFEDLGTRNHEAVGVGIGGVESVNVGTLALALFPELM